MHIVVQCTAVTVGRSHRSVKYAISQISPFFSRLHTESDLVTDEISADGDSELVGDPLRHGDGGHAARLRDGDAAVRQIVQDELWNLRRLACGWLNNWWLNSWMGGWVVA